MTRTGTTYWLSTWEYREGPDVVRETVATEEHPVDTIIRNKGEMVLVHTMPISKEEFERWEAAGV